MDLKALERTIAFIDFEASSLDHGSYPIEIGWALPDSGTVEAHLIKPLPGWTDWDEGSEQVHGIARETLVRDGEPVAAVWRRVEQALGGRTCFCDSLAYDGFWMARLMEGAGHPAAFARAGEVWRGGGITLRHIDALIRDLLGPDGADWLATHGGAAMHRAGDDARDLMKIYRWARDRVRPKNTGEPGPSV